MASGSGWVGHGLWCHLPVVVQSSGKESVEYILEALWRTRNTGLDAADRHIICSMLHLNSHSDLDPLLVCLRMLMRRCVGGNLSKDEIQKLFPPEVSPELQKLLTLLLHKFLPDWRQDIAKEKDSLPRLKAVTWSMADQCSESTNQPAIVNLKLYNDTRSLTKQREVKFQLPKDSLDSMLKGIQLIRDQLTCTTEDNLNGQSQEAAGV